MYCELLRDAGALLVRPEGPSTVAAAIAAFRALVDHPDFRPGAPVIVDLSAIDATECGDVERLADALDAEPPLPAAGLVFLAPEDLTFGFARVVASRAASFLPAARAVVRDRDEALDWLRVDVRAQGLA